MVGTIVQLAGVPHVRYAYRLSDEPTELIRYWPLRP